MSAKEILEKRMAGFYQILSGAHDSGLGLSSSTKGNEREFFVSAFLESIFPNTYRFGTGDIVDSKGVRSGQIDVVVEYPFLPSFPVFGKDSPRLYLADGVALAAEVKSDLGGQWTDVISTNDKLKLLSRSETRITQAVGLTPGIKIPLIAVGFRGWKTKESLLEKLDASSVDAILIIESRLFGNKRVVQKSDKNKTLIDRNVYDGDISLWEFTKFVQKRVGCIAAMTMDIDEY